MIFGNQNDDLDEVSVSKLIAMDTKSCIVV